MSDSESGLDDSNDDAHKSEIIEVIEAAASDDTNQD